MSKFKVGDDVKVIIEHWADDLRFGYVQGYTSYGSAVWFVAGDGVESHAGPFRFDEDELELVDTSDESSEPDMVDRPNHYTAGMPEGVEVIDIINAQGAGYLHGNVLKYVLRWKFKNGLEDLKKARVYLNWLIEKVEAGEDV